MTETELRVAAVLSGLIAIWGLATAAWATKAGVQMWILALGMHQLMLGLALLFMFLLPTGVLRMSLVFALGLGSVGWVVLGIKLLRIERRQDDAGR